MRGDVERRKSLKSSQRRDGGNNSSYTFNREWCRIQIPSRKEFLKGYSEFERREKRDVIYKVATLVISSYWSKPSYVADAISALLLTWNWAFYRYGGFSRDKLEKCIINNFQKIENFRSRDIFSLSSSDENDIKDIFNDFLEALQIESGKMRGKKSPVAVAKVLHLLAPNFFLFGIKKSRELMDAPTIKILRKGILNFAKS